jgi:hypothetical protein
MGAAESANTARQECEVTVEFFGEDTHRQEDCPRTTPQTSAECLLIAGHLIGRDIDLPLEQFATMIRGR